MIEIDDSFHLSELFLNTIIREKYDVILRERIDLLDFRAWIYTEIFPCVVMIKDQFW